MHDSVPWEASIRPGSVYTLPASAQRHKTWGRGGRLAGILRQGQIADPRNDDPRRQSLSVFETLDGVEMRQHLIVQHPERGFERVMNQMRVLLVHPGATGQHL